MIERRIPGRAGILEWYLPLDCVVWHVVWGGTSGAIDSLNGFGYMSYSEPLTARHWSNHRRLYSLNARRRPTVKAFERKEELPLEDSK